MAYDRKELTGSMFPAKYAEGAKRDTDRDWQGDILVDGKSYWISGWNNETGGGLAYQNLKFELKKPKAAAPTVDTIDDDIPF